jgi:ribonuclease Z
MSAFELVVLGTASQVPTRYRNHNGYLLLWEGEGILFDPGEGTQRQMLFAGVSATQLTRICVSHFHGDHSLGLAGLVQRISLDGVPHEIPVHYPASGQVYWERLRRSSIYLDQARLRECPVSTPGVQGEGRGYVLSALRLEHTVESWGYRVEAPARWRADPAALAALGLKGRPVGDLLRDGEVAHAGRTVRREEVAALVPGRSFAFVMDTRRCDAAVELARGVDLLVCESTYRASEATEAWERGHLTAADAAGIAREAGARRLVLTHFSQRHPDVDGFLADAREGFPDVHAVRDLDRIEVPGR